PGLAVAPPRREAERWPQDHPGDGPRNRSLHAPAPRLGRRQVQASGRTLRTARIERRADRVPHAGRLSLPLNPRFPVPEARKSSNLLMLRVNLRRRVSSRPGILRRKNCFGSKIFPYVHFAPEWFPILL